MTTSVHICFEGNSGTFVATDGLVSGPPCVLNTVCGHHCDTATSSVLAAVFCLVLVPHPRPRSSPQYFTRHGVICR